MEVVIFLGDMGRLEVSNPVGQMRVTDLVYWLDMDPNLPSSALAMLDPAHAGMALQPMPQTVPTLVSP